MAGSGALTALLRAALAGAFLAGAAHAAGEADSPWTPIEHRDEDPPPAVVASDRLFPSFPNDFLWTLLEHGGEPVSPDGAQRYVPYPQPGPPGPPGPDGAWTMLPPPSRYASAAVFDPVRDRILVIGGAPPYEDGLIEVWAFAPGGAGSWERLAVGGTPPPGRTYHTAVYDPVRDRVVIFGGNTEYAAYWTSRNDVWALDLASGPTWAPILPSGTPPQARVAAASVYDPVRDRLLIFGGRGASSGDLGDLWQLTLGSAPAWTRLAPVGTGPAARDGAGMVYDPVRDRVVLTGGFVGNEGRSDVWALSLGPAPSWTLLAVGGGPSGHYDQQVVYDAPADRLVAFVGYAFPYQFRGSSQVWTYSLAGPGGWARQAPSSPPLQRFGEAVAYDAHRRRVFMCWGWDSNATPYGGEAYTEAWDLSLQDMRWTEISPAGAAPNQRLAHTATYDPVRRRMIVVGGFATGLLRSSAIPAGDSWALGLSAPSRWEPLAGPKSLPGRAWHTTIYDSARDRLVVFGGLAYLPNSYTSVHLDDVWALPLAGPALWTRLSPSGVGPGRKAYHTAIYDPSRDRMIVYGGRDEDYLQRSDEVWELSFSGAPTWTRLAPGGDRPPGRVGHTAIHDPVGRRMVVFGGQTATSGFFTTNEVFGLELSANLRWSMIPAAGSQGLPVGRTLHGAIYDDLRRRMIVMGGTADTYNYTRVNDVWQLSLQGQVEWVPLATEPLGPRYRTSFGLIYDSAGDQVVQSAGNLNTPLFFDVWWLDLPGPAHATSAATAPRLDDGPRPGRPGLRAFAPAGAGGLLSVSGRLGRAGAAVLDVLDVRGRRVASRGLSTDADGGFTARLVVDVPPGIYFVLVRQGAERAVTRVAVLE